MTRPPVRWLLLIATGVIALGSYLLAARIATYLDNPRAISSTAGLVVFRVHEGYASYVPFAASVEPTLIGIGVVLLVGAVFVAAAVWRPRVY